MATDDSKRNVPTRGQVRVGAEVAVKLENGTSGITRNISPNGVYFAIDAPLVQLGQLIRFSVDFDGPLIRGEALRLHCVGKVVRIVDETAGKIGVGVSIIESRLERKPARLRRVKAA